LPFELLRLSVYFGEDYSHLAWAFTAEEIGLVLDHPVLASDLIHIFSFFGILAVIV